MKRALLLLAALPIGCATASIRTPSAAHASDSSILGTGIASVIASTPDGSTIAVAWLTIHGIAVARSFDHGAHFSETSIPCSLTDPTVHCTVPSIAVSLKGEVDVAWRTRLGDLNLGSIVVAHAPAWGPFEPHAVAAILGPFDPPSIVDLPNETLVAYAATHFDSTEIFVRHLREHGDAVEQQVSTADQAVSPRLCASPDRRNVHLLYAIGATEIVERASEDGVQWESARHLFDDLAHDIVRVGNASCAASNGTVAVVEGVALDLSDERRRGAAQYARVERAIADRPFVTLNVDADPEHELRALAIATGDEGVTLSYDLVTKSDPSHALVQLETWPREGRAQRTALQILSSGGAWGDAITTTDGLFVTMNAGDAVVLLHPCGKHPSEP